MILDLHTHQLPPAKSGVIAICIKADGSDNARKLITGNITQLFSVGIHPWDAATVTGEAGDKMLARIEELAALPNVVAIGECGIDTVQGNAPMFQQITVLKRQIEISERVGLPMVMHDVKAHDILVGMRRDLKPTQQWAIHGFRLKASVAEMLLRAGFWLSVGPEFNPDALKVIPRDRLLTETDDFSVNIEDVVTRIANALGDEELRNKISENSAEFLNLKND
jgi:TatD DNase family protein